MDLMTLKCISLNNNKAVMIDYIFLRSYEFYKRNRDGSPKLMGKLFLSLLIFLTLLSVYGVTSLIFQWNLVPELKPLSLLLMFVIYMIVSRRYRKDETTQALLDKYAKEDANARYIKGLGILIYFVLLLLTIIISARLIKA